MMAWIKLDRSFQNDEMWKERREYSRAEAWIDLLFMRSHQRVKVSRGGTEHVINEDECAVTERFLAARWNWTRRKVGCYLKYLESRGKVIRRKDDGQATIIRIINEPPNVPPNVPPNEPPNTNDIQKVIEFNVPPNEPPNVPPNVPQLQEYNTMYNISSSSPRARIEDINNTIYARGIDDEINEMMNNASWCEQFCMTMHVGITDLMMALKSFGDSCKIGMQTHKSMMDAYCHFRDWYNKQKDNGRNKKRSSADYIRDAQRTAIERTQMLIAEAKRRRGEI